MFTEETEVNDVIHWKTVCNLWTPSPAHTRNSESNDTKSSQHVDYTIVCKRLINPIILF